MACVAWRDNTMKIDIRPNLDQIRFYANSALVALRYNSDEEARKFVQADMEALLRYLDALDAGNGVVVVGIAKLECGVRLEVSRTHDKVFDLIDRYPESAGDITNASGQPQTTVLDRVEDVRAHGNGIAAEPEIDLKAFVERGAQR